MCFIAGNDVYLNIAAAENTGTRADLKAAALTSASNGAPLWETVIFGEVGLSGEIQIRPGPRHA